MKKGISPIVAVVLLIAIAVIAAVGLYFWVGGLATKQPTPNPPRTITAYAVHCAANDTDTTTIMIANNSPPGTPAVNITKLEDSKGNPFNSDAVNSWLCDADSINSGNQTSCAIEGAYFKSGDGTIAIYGPDIASATVTC